MRSMCSAPSGGARTDLVGSTQRVGDVRGGVEVCVGVVGVRRACVRWRSQRALIRSGPHAEHMFRTVGWGSNRPGGAGAEGRGCARRGGGLRGRRRGARSVCSVAQSARLVRGGLHAEHMFRTVGRGSNRPGGAGAEGRGCARRGGGLRGRRRGARSVCSVAQSGRPASRRAVLRAAAPLFGPPRRPPRRPAGRRTSPAASFARPAARAARTRPTADTPA